MSNEEDKSNLEEELNKTEEVELETPSDEISQDREELDTSAESEEEIKARKNGWDPSKGTKTAREFNLTGELIDLKKTVQKRDKDIEEIVKYHQQTIEQQKTNYRKQLEKALEDAKYSGDVPNVEALTKQKADLDYAEKQHAAQKTQQDVQRAIESFIDRNKHWYNLEHPELKQKAEQLETEIISGNFALRTGIPRPTTYEDVLKQIEFTMSREAPDLVNVRETSRPVVSSTKSSVNKSVATSSDSSDNSLYSKLSPNEKAMYNVLKRINKNTSYTVKEFLEKSKRDEEI